LLVKVNKPNRYFALSVDKHHRGSRTHHTSHPLATPSLLTSSQENQEQIPDIITNIPAKQISHHGHLEEHQELIKRRNRAARK
jgi:hypothetical protein